MASTHTSKTLLTSQSLAASTAVNATEWNLSTAYGGLLAVKITNGATAPTVAPTIQFYVGEATGTKRKFYAVTGDTVNNSVTDAICELPVGTMFANVTITQGASTNAVTVEAYGQELTGI